MTHFFLYDIYRAPPPLYEISIPKISEFPNCTFYTFCQNLNFQILDFQKLYPEKQIMEKFQARNCTFYTFHECKILDQQKCKKCHVFPPPLRRRFFRHFLFSRILLSVLLDRINFCDKSPLTIQLPTNRKRSNHHDKTHLNCKSYLINFNHSFGIIKR